jgi:hypothetical protein
LPNNPRSLSLAKQIKKFEKIRKKKILDAIILSKLQTNEKNSKEKKFWTPFTPSCRPAEVQTHSFFHFTPKVFPLTKVLLPPSITSACRPPRSSSRRPPATPPPADKSDVRHLHHQQPSTTVLNGPNATTHDPPSRGVNFLKGFFLLIFNSDRCYIIELMNLMAYIYIYFMMQNCVHILRKNFYLRST